IDEELMHVEAVLIIGQGRRVKMVLSPGGDALDKHASPVLILDVRVVIVTMQEVSILSRRGAAEIALILAEIFVRDRLETAAELRGRARAGSPVRAYGRQRASPPRPRSAAPRVRRAKTKRAARPGAVPCRPPKLHQRVAQVLSSRVGFNPEQIFAAHKSFAQM